MYSDPQPSNERPAAAPQPTISRMAPCPCGSGQRYKNCCGSNQLPPLDAMRRTALQAQRVGDLQAAIAGYRSVLAAQPADHDALHMLALCQYQLGCLPESLALFKRLLLQLPALPEAVWQNLNLVVAAMAFQADHALTAAQRARYASWRDEVTRARPDDAATVSVVIPSYNHAHFVNEGIASVLAQSRLPDEIIVIDDGSRDGSAQIVRDALAGSTVRHRVIARENRGAAETLNEAIDLATGDWIAPLNSDDRYDVYRLERLVGTCASAGIDWGFGGIEVIAADGATLGRRHDVARNLYSIHDSLHMSDGAGLSFLRHNAAISTGNLFFRKSLWRRVGGFASLRYNHDWRFCLEAARHAEPLFVPDARYGYRWHGGNTISDSSTAPRGEAMALYRDYFSLVEREGVGANPFAPLAAAWGPASWAMLAAGGQLQALPVGRLLEIFAALAAPYAAAH